MTQQSSRPKKLIIFGAGGHGRELAWLAEETGWTADSLVFAVDRPEFLADKINDIPVRLLSEIEATLDEAAYIVALGDPKARERCAMLCEQAGYRPITLVHPRAERSRWVEIDQGSIICAGVILTTNIQIGHHVHINVGCTVSHDAVIGDYATISPGVHISGHVHIGRHVFIGTGASIINGTSQHPITIGDGAIIAAGACVIGLVEPGAMVAGVPAVRKR